MHFYSGLPMHFVSGVDNDTALTQDLDVVFGMEHVEQKQLPARPHNPHDLLKRPAATGTLGDIVDDKAGQDDVKRI